jgi:hypothetical protein
VYNQNNTYSFVKMHCSWRINDTVALKKKFIQARALVSRRLELTVDFGCLGDRQKGDKENNSLGRRKKVLLNVG